MAKLLIECPIVIILQIREANITVIKVLSFAYKLPPWGVALSL